MMSDNCYNRYKWVIVAGRNKKREVRFFRDHQRELGSQMGREKMSQALGKLGKEISKNCVQGHQIQSRHTTGETVLKRGLSGSSCN